MDISFSGQTVLVTGATKGIGAAIASAFEAAGASLLLTGTQANAVDALNRRNAEQGIRHIRWLQADFSSPDGTDRFLENLAAEGPIQVLVNNAGTNRLNPIDQVQTKDLDALLSINLRAPLLLCRELGRSMKEAGYGRIVNIASIAGKEGNPNASHYSASKAGLIALTKSLGKELAGTGVVVNCITPAAARTPIFDQMKQEHIDYMLSKIPLNRFLEPDEAAALIAWLASEDCAFSTGAVFDISGGRATY